MVTVMKKVPLTQLKDDLSRYLRLAEEEQIIITRHGQPAGILMGFASEEDWFDYQLENDPRFLKRIERPSGKTASWRRSQARRRRTPKETANKRLNVSGGSRRTCKERFLAAATLTVPFAASGRAVAWIPNQVTD